MKMSKRGAASLLPAAAAAVGIGPSAQAISIPHYEHFPTRAPCLAEAVSVAGMGYTVSSWCRPVGYAPYQYLLKYSKTL
jgi:hypothetical protein